MLTNLPINLLNNIAPSDIVLSVMLAFGILQLAWFSVMLVRRGIAASMIQQALPALLTVWVLMWPVYVNSHWLSLGLITLCVPIVLATWLPTPFWQHLRLAWGEQIIEAEQEPRVTSSPQTASSPQIAPLPQMHLLIALGIAAAWFQNIPEFGFGLALCLCVAFPAAYWTDYISQRYHFLTLGFPAHPEQTLAGHLIFIIACTMLLCWSLHVYHGTDWQSLFIATLIASMAASLCRAVVPGRWNAPAAVLSVGTVMWLL